MKRICLTALLSFAAIEAHAVVLSTGPGNAGFETVETTGGGRSTTTGHWEGDDSDIVPSDTVTIPFTTSTLTVTPRTGSGMLRFLGTERTADIPTIAAQLGGLSGTGSDVFQSVDLSPWASSIDIANNVTIDLSGYFNTVDSDVDGFLVRVLFYAGNPVDFPTATPIGGFGDGTINPFNQIVPDSDSTTWQLASVSGVVVPTTADYLVIRLGVLGDSDLAPVEIKGAYADDISLTISAVDPVSNDPPGPVIPEPTRAALLLIGALSLVTRRKRR